MVKGPPLASGSQILALSLCLFGATASADSEGVVAVRELLTRHAATPGISIQVEIPESSRQKLADCPRPEVALAGHGPPRWGSLTVRATCDASQQPVFVRARVSAVGDYWVLAQDVQVGTPLAGERLQQRRGDLTQLPGNAITEPKQLSGKVAARPLRAGTILQSHWLKSPALVKRRDRVNLLVEGRGFRIIREGRALDEGGRGDRVRVRLDNRKVMTGIVSDADTVTLPGN